MPTAIPVYCPEKAGCWFAGNTLQLWGISAWISAWWMLRTYLNVKKYDEVVLIGKQGENTIFGR